MTDRQWAQLLRILEGELLEPLPVGFLVDGPWVSHVVGAALLDYFTDREVWLRANLEAHRRHPDILLIPGFWAEFGMISNPPAFGARCIWPEDGFPTCDPVLRGYEDIDRLKPPDVRTDGLLPLLVRRLEQSRLAIEDAGHRIRFATSHGPLTVASYLLGHGEFFLGLRTEPEPIHRLLRTVTTFVVDWLRLQKERFPSIDGVLILDDFLGFVGERDFLRFALPYMTEIFAALDVSVRFLHNDAFGLVTARHLEAMGVNLFNFSFEHELEEVRELAGDGVTLMGNIPPRDVLLEGTPDDVRRSVERLLGSISTRRRVILSAGGFAPPQLSPEKVAAFTGAVRDSTRGRSSV